MSDLVLEEEDDLISQDDIDKLLDISSEDDDDDGGELSQNDIDSLLNGPGLDADDADAGEEDAGELSQDDIDRMMGGNALDDDDTPEDAGGELSQNDIDSLLNGPGLDKDDADAGEEDAGELSQDDIDRMMSGDDDLDEDLELISQDDIDQFINGGDDDDDDDDELISLEDIQGVMSADTQGSDASEPESDLVPAAEDEPGVWDAESNQDDMMAQKEEDEAVDDAPATDALGLEEDPLDEPINEGQAADVADCMITQEAMDALIEASLPAPDVPEADVPEADVGASDADAGDDGDDSLLDGIDLTSETDTGGTYDAIEEDENDVTQDDIDALLQQSDENDGFLNEDEDILISQDDINTLLMAADQEDEDILGEIGGENDASDLEDQLDDLKSDSDQVILEGIDGAEFLGKNESVPAGPSKSGKIRALFRSKAMLAAASVLLFMGISVPLSYFLFFSSKSVPLPKRQTASLTEIDLIRAGQSNVLADTPDLPPSRRSGNILLTDFIILASDQSQTMTYVSADVSIDYSDQRAYTEINSNLAFYRDLIYGAIQTRLVSEKNNEVTEADLLWDVEASLKKVLPPQYIDKISFKTFKAT
ncbi:hypothetical protein [Desulfobacter vibrioformis]|uniref:hypothetical protein n=1 Tax=Desulfobacter vibrioformis TaxID=34031 RepID=UPI000551E9FB|nr:hypothetical protein [Desulfobacter vibrioformis]